MSQARTEPAQAPARSPTPTALGVVNGLIFAAGPATVDLSLPAMPTIQQAIGTAQLHIELTLTLLLFGLAISQLLYGAVADRFGRLAPLLAGLATYSIASLFAALAPGAMAFAAARVAQALGYGVAIVLCRSAVADVCDERATARVFSVAITVMAIASVLAPAIGGQILVHLGWRAVFHSMALYGAVTLVATMLLLPETHPRTRRSVVPLAQTFSSYAHLLRDARIRGFCLIAASIVACQFTYNTAGPGMLIEHYGLSAASAGIVLSVIALSTAVAAPLNVLALRWRSPEQVMRATVLIAVLAALALLSLLALRLPVAGVIVALFVLIATPGLVVTNAMAGAISSAGSRAGAASALVGVLQFAFGTVGSGIAGLFHDTSGRVMAVVIVTFTAIALFVGLRLRNVAVE
ncbi:MAG TPA: Bcr/CflA family efflux MFS transporter [Steroidobacteraceae bacterium]|nr:Bcr/CflA family efflux MFS transporter [Steroidobacteraceae bacterium]